MRRGVTVVELMMAVLIGAILAVAVTRLLSGGMRISQKGAAHLTTVQNAGILLSRIERDLERAVQADPGPGGSMILRLLSPAGEVAASYRPAAGGLGVTRTVTGSGAEAGDEGEGHTFARGLPTVLRWRRATVEGSVGFFVTVTVSSGPEGGETHTLERFILCRNDPATRARLTTGWTW
ncbi:MAG: prepilin-type N-terminal cleavage/methylation domain-containing protein [Candidatus Riflebacteria bacterium]|nr:prepilin-type N-terminal cleavage/methylation domain-containing protein [Candidatus Riflebacteria bacterium]